MNTLWNLWRRAAYGLAWLLVSLPVAATGAETEFDGIWRSQGYGSVFELGNGTATIYDETAVSFLPVATATVQGNIGTLDDDPNADPFFLDRDGEQLVVVNEATTIRFDRLGSLPPVRGTDSAPVNVFDVFWQNIEEHFPSFELLGLDWSAQRDAWRPQARPDLSANQLQDLLASMAEPLLDGHTTLLNPVNGRFVNTGPRPGRLADTLAQAVLDNVGLNYVDGGRFSRLDGDSRLLWGTLAGGRFGYLAIRDYENRPAPFADSLDTVLADLQQTEALLIDLRHNDGGNNRHALTLGRRLADRARLVYQQQARFGGPEEFTAPVPHFVEPEGAGYRGRPVYLLTNDGTASAGDVQTLVLASLPFVTQVGEPSRGMFSQIRRGLPNGWILTTSNERFLSPDGLNYELLGIAPEIPVANTEEALNRGEDLLVEAALADHDKRLPLEAGSLPVSAAMSGSWYAPDHDGEGFLLEVLDAERAVIYWFSYAPDAGVQEWLVAVGRVQDDRIEFDEVLAPRGARFGSGFDPADVVRAPWGQATLHFTSCDRALVTYDGPDRHGANFKSLQRLTGHHGVECEPAPSNLPNRISGSWYDPDRSGEGWILGQVSEDLALAVWFTYGNAGEPLWLIGTGDVLGDMVVFDDLLEPIGGRFGPAFRPQDVERRHWGRATVQLRSCGELEVEWQPDSPDYEPGSRILTRLTTLAGLECEQAAER